MMTVKVIQNEYAYKKEAILIMIRTISLFAMTKMLEVVIILMVIKQTAIMTADIVLNSLIFIHRLTDIYCSFKHSS